MKFCYRCMATNEPFTDALGLMRFLRFFRDWYCSVVFLWFPDGGSVSQLSAPEDG